MTQFKENIIFNMLKDIPTKSAKRFKDEVFKKFEITCESASELYRKIINYQINKYGSQLDFVSSSRYIENFRDKSTKRINYKRSRNELNYETKKLIERNEV